MIGLRGKCSTCLVTLATIGVVGLCLGRQPAEPTAHVVFLVDENECQAEKALTLFARELETKHKFQTTVITAPGKDPKAAPNLDPLGRAELLVVVLQEREWPIEAVNQVKAFLAAGKPLVALRTANHGFKNWEAFGKDVLGAPFRGAQERSSATDVTIAAGAANHPVLQGVPSDIPFRSWLYKVDSLPPGATPLLVGASVGPGAKPDGQRPATPVAWTRAYEKSRVFYTSLGHSDDFRIDSFRRLLTNAIFWGLGKNPPAEEATTRPQVVLSVHVVRISDDDGARPVNLTPTQFREWLRFANRVFAVARIRFEFDPQADWSELKETLLNNMTGTSDANWLEARDAANAEAAKHPGKLLVVARHGPGASPTGGGFSWTDYNFVVMPGFWDTWVCGNQNRRVFAHESGHFLGLAHPFGKEFNTIADAEAYFKEKKGDPRVFDGDRLTDTPPEPFIKELQDQYDKTTVKLGNYTFRLVRNNLMTYYHEATEERTTLTQQQVAVIHKTLREHLHRRTLVQAAK